MRPADSYALNALSFHFDTAKALEVIELYWPDSEAMPSVREVYFCDLLPKASVSMVFRWRGQIYDMAEEKRWSGRIRR
jgi:hypothetical protein